MKNSKSPLISIVIPVYNAANYLAGCFESLQKQTYENLQIIFINDASTDDSLKILEEFKKQDERVVVVSQECNKGVSAARNAGLDVCTGDYIGFCDADDVCEPDMFSNMLASAQRKGAEIACCAIRCVDSDGTFQRSLWDAPIDFVMDASEAMKNWLIGKYVGNSVYTKLTKRELWGGVRFPEGELFEEAKVIPQLLARAKKIVHCGTREYNYFYRSDSLTKKPINERVLTVFSREEYIRDFVLPRYPELEEAVKCFEIRMNHSLMVSAEIDKRMIDKTLYDTINQHFQSVFWDGLKNRCISLKDKLRLLEVKTKVFYFRKNYLHM